jgi:hypothetical protein
MTGGLRSLFLADNKEFSLEKPVPRSRLFVCAQNCIRIRIHSVALFLIEASQKRYNQKMYKSCNCCAHFHLENESVVVKADLAK